MLLLRRYIFGLCALAMNKYNIQQTDVKHCTSTNLLTLF